MSGITGNEWDIGKPVSSFYKKNSSILSFLFILQNILCRIENLFPKYYNKLYETPQNWVFIV